MAYQVIARKYRPQRFSDVVGQEHVTQTLANAIARNRIAHAYLFCGPRGTGKTTIARIFAKCLNCTGGPGVDFSDDDPRCREIAEGRSLDVLEIDAASNRGIDEIRGLRETVRYAPASSKFKVYIIDEVHMLTKEAFNALLKTLEEPPEHVKFMFATTEPEKVLPTILSRCQRFDLRRIPSALIIKHLAQIAGQEKVKIDEPALYAIARGAEGGMRDAESTLDQLISFCGDKIEESDVLSMFGLTAQQQLLDLSKAVLHGEADAALRGLNDLASNGKDLGRLLSDLLNHFRNLLVFHVSRGDTSMLELSEVEAASLNEQAQLATADGLTRILEVFGDAEMRLRDASSKKILLEVALLKAIEARNAVSLDAVLRKLEQVRSAGSARAPETPPQAPPRTTAAVQSSALPRSTTAPVPPVHKVSPPAPAEPAPHAARAEPPPAEPSGEHVLAETPPPAGLDKLWIELLETVGRASPFTRSYLLEAHPVSLANSVLTIGFPSEFADHIALVDNPRNQALLQNKLGELGHPGLHIKFVKSDPPEGSRPAPPPVPTPERAPVQRTPAPTPAQGAASRSPAGPPAARAKSTPPPPLNKEEFKNDPLIRQALDVFKGQIVEVRG